VRRNLPPEKRRQAAKWRRAVATVDWLLTQMPAAAHFQVFTFADSTQAAVASTRGTWMAAADRAQLARVTSALSAIAPAGGTNLEDAFRSLLTLNPRPDNVLLLTDGLPTRGSKASRRGTVSGKERLRLFDQAVDALPRGLPVNTVLFPMEGDPMAASAFWKLAMSTRGSYLAPSEDWP
jgi:hypothetical protein